ncbi:protein kinase domain-containing protein [Haliangium sp.]|uniref:serine/threonine-protein kinase n=1 Tax=Haliangium sp. TaxID=2663208 RepID=UPI003D131BBB
MEQILAAAAHPTDRRLKQANGVDWLVQQADTVIDAQGHDDSIDIVEEVSMMVGPGDRGSFLPQPGSRLYQYELIRGIGSGGMGSVYLARDTKLGRRVAIKFLQQQSHSLSERFLREAQATARCSHENIVIIHDVKEFRDTPFMVLEYLRGQSLGALLEGGRMPPRRAVQLIVPVVRALVCAHQHRIVHRDLKPANIFMTDGGVIKVLDFGIAKFIYNSSGSIMNSLFQSIPKEKQQLTGYGMLVGTLPYMSPEQWGADKIDHRTDIWAAGILLYQMIVGQHPLAPRSGSQLVVIAELDQPMPSLHNAGVDVPAPLADIVDTCLKKRKQERFPNAGKLLTALEALLPGRRPAEISAGEGPYTGLNAFQEADAGRFFGRSREIRSATAKLMGAPLIAIVGPSGVGKSSFIRAGVIPALKQTGELWETMVVRPGRHPMGALANIVVPLITSTAATLSSQVAEHQAALQRLYEEPGYLGTVLRNRARSQGRKLLLFIDQFEELYTLMRDTEERRAFTACLTGLADDPLSPLRLVLSVRSDFLDRVAEDCYFMAELSHNLLFLTPPDRSGLREAIMRPAEMMHFRFENPSMIEHMLDTLQVTTGCLPLLQFAVTKLWEARDRNRRLITEQSYRRLGGVVGALATHADAVVASMTPRAQAVARSIFLQLVTPERTRALTSIGELCELAEHPHDVEQIIHQLVDARLLVVQRSSRPGGATVEIVHEALIHTWPTLTHWLDDNQENAAFLAQLRTAAKQWHERGCTRDLLWRGDMMDEARSWRRRYRGAVPPIQEEFLSETFALAARIARRTRAAVASIIIFLSLLVAIGGVALVTIQEAKQVATDRLEAIQREQRAKRAALAQAESASARADMSEEDLRRANAELQQALTAAEDAKNKAETESERARAATEEATRLNRKLQKLLDEREEELRKLRRGKAQRGTELK